MNDSQGWLITYDATTGSNIWHTTDSGKFWTYIGTPNVAHDLYFDLAGSVQPSPGTAISKLSDSVWITTYDHSSFGCTTDAGKSWTYAHWNPKVLPFCGVPIAESFGIYSSRAWNAIFTAPESIWQNPLLPPTGYAPAISRDTGKTWYLGPNWPNGWESTGDAEGGMKAVYAQSGSANSEGSNSPSHPPFTPFMGLERTTDTGKTWVNVGGPSNFFDSRFYVIDCIGAEVAAFGIDGSIWLTTDGGDGTLHPENAHPKFTSYPAVAKATLCQDTIGGLRIFNDHCDSIIVLSMALLDSTSLAVTSGAFGFDSLRQTPFSMESGTEDSIGFHWNPLGKIAVDTNFTLHLKVHYFSQTNDSVMDTILPIQLSATYSGSEFALSSSNIDLGTVSTCTSPDTTIVLSNFGCVPLFIDSSTLSGAGFLLLDSIHSPIAPGSSDSIRVRLVPLSGDNYGRLSLYVNNQGTHSSLYVDLTGRGVQGSGVLAMRSTSLLAGSLSFCSGDTLVTDTLRNLGCDTLVLTSLHLSGDTAFSLVSVPDSLLLPGDSAIVIIAFEPRLKGPHAATLTFHERNIVNDPGTIPR